jgi:hypothetical protein
MPPILKPTLVCPHHTQLVPTAHAKYNCEEVDKLSRLSPLDPGNTNPCKEVQFFRDVPTKGMIQYLKDHVLEPVKVKAVNMPNGRPFSNFAKVLYTGHAVYCALEGKQSI